MKRHLFACCLTVLATLLSMLLCATPLPQNGATSNKPKTTLSGKTDIPMLLPGKNPASWKTEEASFDKSRYYFISKYSPVGNESITILASAEKEMGSSKSGKTVAIPEIGNVRYRQCSVGGDGEPPRYETDPFARDDGHGGKVRYIIRVNTDRGNQETLMSSVRWAPPGTMP
jgi:hypothetical protein